MSIMPLGIDIGILDNNESKTVETRSQIAIRIERIVLKQARLWTDDELATLDVISDLDKEMEGLKLGEYGDEKRYIQGLEKREELRKLLGERTWSDATKMILDKLVIGGKDQLMGKVPSEVFQDNASGSYPLSMDPISVGLEVALSITNVGDKREFRGAYFCRVL